MTSSLYRAGLLLVLIGGFALAQNMPQHKQPQQYPPAMPQTQQQPPTSDQSKVSTANKSDLQNEIQTALQADPTLVGANINVQVTDKNVELTGTVPSKDAKGTAQEIAKAHSGGLGVKNKLKVSQGSSGSRTPYM